MEYSKEIAKAYVGKRVIVSLKIIDENQTESYGGLWGVIDSVNEDGMLLKVEGGMEEEFWMLPHDRDSLEIAREIFFHLANDEHVVTNVGFEVYYIMAYAVHGIKHT